MFDKLIQSNIRDLRPYQPGMTIQQLSRQYSVNEDDIIKLASNENPLGPSPKVIEEITKATQEANRYPDQFALTQAIAQHHHTDENRIIIGNGSNDVLDLIARVFLGPNTEAICSQYGFQVYRLLTKLANAKSVVTPAIDYGHDLAAMLRSITPITRIIWIANPNNPTGTFVSYKEIKEFLTQVPDYVIVVLDEAYYEYLDASYQIDSTTLLNDFPQLIIVRTFSKIYGLAGFRVGYGVAHPELVSILQRVRQPFNVSGPSLAAATAALTDQAYVEKTRLLNQEGLAYLEAEFDKLNIEYIKSFTNFVTIVHEDAATIYERLLQKGIIVRPLIGDDLPNCLRCSVGTLKENQALIKALSSIL